MSARCISIVGYRGIVQLGCAKQKRHLLGTAPRKQLRPFVGIEKIGGERRCKLLIAKARLVVSLHELNVLGIAIRPIDPEPFGAKCRHRINAPMDENANFGRIIPTGQRPRIQTVPRRLVFRIAERRYHRVTLLFPFFAVNRERVEQIMLRQEYLNVYRELGLAHCYLCVICKDYSLRFAIVRKTGLGRPKQAGECDC